jgi:hypothetical protein
MIHGMLYGLTHYAKGRMIIEADLLEKVRKAQCDWRQAPSEEQETARARFMAALYAFNNVVLYG